MDAVQRRKEIMAAAVEVFAESNYRGGGVAAIARRAGVSEALLYKHFSSKKALLCEILERVGTSIPAIWEEATAGEPTALAALGTAGELYLRNLAVHPAEAALQFRALAETSDPEIAAVLAANHRGYVEFFEQLLLRGQGDGSIRADIDAHAAALTLNASGLAFTLNQQLGLDPDGAEARSVMRAQLDWLANPGHNQAEGNAQ
ncbi:MAG: TetR/AcrR family transcriptional regulator [Actinomycetia bacterium]|nr:TetR/AcrR family transcriptional regulator [Actinomycetes bacterium]MCP4084053.1 TetR/AcrR family transcriptional regulator [Actinomycetes bacterium]